MSLEGSFAVDGRPCTTVFSSLRAKQKDYTPAWAAAKTHIDEDTLVEITRQYACEGPSVLAMGWGGIDKFSNADIVGHAAVMLATLVGAFGVDDGSGAGVYVNSYEKGFGMVGMPAWPLPEE